MAWSDSLKESTRENVFDGAVLKNDDYDYGIFARLDGKIKIFGVESKNGMPMPTDNIVATFDTVDEMIEAGWVMD